MFKIGDVMISLFEYYLETGGITMYPLIGCCLWMWWKIIYHLPCWQKKLSEEVEGIRQEYRKLSTGSIRHKKSVLYRLQKSSNSRNIQGIDTIKVLATIAPFLGLFGTVTGMINTFQSVAIYGLANPKALAGGISEAMVTTQFGLLVAVPGVLAVYFLRRGAIRRQNIIEQKTADLVTGGAL